MQDRPDFFILIQITVILQTYHPPSEVMRQIVYRLY